MKILNVSYNHQSHTVVLYEGMSIDELNKLLHTTIFNDIPHKIHSTIQILGVRCIDTGRMYTLDDMIDSMAQLSNNVELIVKNNKSMTPNATQRPAGLFSPLQRMPQTQPTSPNFMLNTTAKTQHTTTQSYKPYNVNVSQYRPTTSSSIQSNISQRNTQLMQQLKSVLQPTDHAVNNNNKHITLNVTLIASKFQLNDIIQRNTDDIIVVLTTSPSHTSKSLIKQYYNAASKSKYSKIEFIELKLRDATTNISFYLYGELLSSLDSPTNTDIQSMLDKCVQLINNTTHHTTTDTTDILSTLLSPPHHATIPDDDDNDSLNDDTQQFKQLVQEYEQRYNKPAFSTKPVNNNWIGSNHASAGNSFVADSSLNESQQSSSIRAAINNRPTTSNTDVQSLLSQPDTYKLLNTTEAAVLDALISKQDARVKAVYRIYPEMEHLLTSYIRLARHVLESYNIDENESVTDDNTEMVPNTHNHIDTVIPDTNNVNTTTATTVNDTLKTEVLYDVTVEMLKRGLLTHQQATFIYELHNKNNSLLNMALNIFCQDRDVGTLLQRLLELLKLLYKPSVEDVETHVDTDDTESIYATEDTTKSQNTILQRIEQAQQELNNNNTANTVQSQQLDTDQQQYQQTRNSIESLVQSIDHTGNTTDQQNTEQLHAEAAAKRKQLQEAKQALYNNFQHFIQLFEQNNLLSKNEATIILANLRASDDSDVEKVFIQFSANQDIATLVTALKQIAAVNKQEISVPTTQQPPTVQQQSTAVTDFSTLNDTDLQRVEQHIKSLLPTELKLTPQQESTLHSLIHSYNTELLTAYQQILDIVLNAKHITSDNTKYTPQQQLEILLKYKQCIESFAELVLKAVDKRATVELLNDSYTSTTSQQQQQNNNTVDNDTDSVTESELQQQNADLELHTIQLARKLIDLMSSKDMYTSHEVTVLNQLLDNKDDTTIVTFVSAIQSEDWIKMLERTKTLVALQSVQQQSNNSTDTKQSSEVKEQSSTAEQNSNDMISAFSDVLQAMYDDSLITVNQRAILLALFEQQNAQLYDVMQQFIQHSNVEQLQKGIQIIAQFYEQRLSELNNQQNSNDDTTVIDSNDIVEAKQQSSTTSYDMNENSTAREIPIE